MIFFPGDFFANCHSEEEDFDDCIKEALNNVRPYFKGGKTCLTPLDHQYSKQHYFLPGIPQMGIEPFDPFFAREVIQTRRIDPMFNYKLRLMNVTETGWTQSQVTRFK